MKEIFEEDWKKLEEEEKKRKEKEARKTKTSIDAYHRREKPHRFEVKDQKVLIRLRKWQEEMQYGDFSDTELLVILTKEWIDKRRAEMIPIEPFTKDKRQLGLFS